MPIIRAQMNLLHDSGLPEDKTVNTWHFTPLTGGTTDQNNIRDNLVSFYNGSNPVAGATVASFLSTVLTGDYELSLYNLADPEPRAPIAEYTGTFSIGSGVALPAEVACCLSFEAVPVSGEIQARRRGRVYIGPLDNSASDSAGTRPAQQLRDALAEAGERLMTESDTDSTFWSVYSRVDNATVAVERGWIDNAFDTQRRRGEAPTDRQLWP
jgi:hypothetical protein